VLPPGASLTLPAAGGGVNRALYFLEGAELTVGGQTLRQRSMCHLDAAKAAVLRGPAPSEGRQGQAAAEVLVLQGRPIGAPVAQRGPFVMNTQVRNSAKSRGLAR
jgi:redox-sensitive bicupin YhaK (pirin superfamily)